MGASIEDVLNRIEAMDAHTSKVLEPLLFHGSAPEDEIDLLARLELYGRLNKIDDKIKILTFNLVCRGLSKDTLLRSEDKQNYNKCTSLRDQGASNQKQCTCTCSKTLELYGTQSDFESSDDYVMEDHKKRGCESKENEDPNESGMEWSLGNTEEEDGMGSKDGGNFEESYQRWQ